MSLPLDDAHERTVLEPDLTGATIATSPARTPLRISTIPSWIVPTATSRRCAVESSTTYT